ncbi:AAA family ATPase [Succinimonas sp.]|uniref:AAA family ATPase n=1 Tax=Succinimonas sp. TaxID=1936151 RepID=UPI00386963BB
MGYFLNPDRENSFTNLVKSGDNAIFVDKTDFIEIISSKINDVKRFFAVTRPRRFGKTVTAHMLSAYFSKGYEGQNIFNGLKISGKDSYEKHLNKHNVIYIDMNSVRDRYKEYVEDEDLQVKGVTTFVDFLKYKIVKELKENEKYADLLGKSDEVGKKSLLSALQVICGYAKEKFILIMDEWDLVYRDYRYDTKLQKDFIDLLTSLFKSDDGQSCFALAYLTGILPIKKYNSQSALNTFLEYNMLAPEPFEAYFGFTEAEICEIVKRPSCKLTREELKDWYEGYELNGTDIYNPNSVVSAVTDGTCKNYWSGTSSNDEVAHLINMDYDGIREDILNLIEGKEIVFNCGRFQNDMVSIESKDDVFCLLVCLGYLGCKKNSNNTSDAAKNNTGNRQDEKTEEAETEQDKQLGKLGEALRKNRRIAYVPNAEIKSALMDIVKKQEWYERMETIKRSERLLNAIKTLDGNETARLIQEVHNSPAVSIYDYNTESALTYCVITGLMWSTLDDYDYHREDQAGKGKVDLVYEPAARGRDPLILIEFKYGKSAKEALRQIKKQEYFRRYTKKYTKNIILAGINYDPKSKEHQCLIEKLC